MSGQQYSAINIMTDPVEQLLWAIENDVPIKTVNDIIRKQKTAAARAARARNVTRNNGTKKDATVFDHKTDKARRLDPEVVREKIIKALNRPFPINVRWIAKIKFVNHASRDQKISTRKDEYNRILKTEAEKRDYIENIIGKVLNYKFVTELAARGYEYDRIKSLELKFIDNKNKRTVVRVARSEADNCVINLIRSLPGRNADVIYEKYPELRPTGAPIYIDSAMIDAIGKLTSTNIITYTELGARVGQEWENLGKIGGKKIHMKIQNEHATIHFTRQFNITDIKYEDNMVVPTTTDVVSAEYKFPNADGTGGISPKFWITVDKNNFTMHKAFRPSSITKKLADDKNMDYAYMTDKNQFMYKLFKEKHDLRPVSNTYVDVVRKAEHFIGRNRFEDVSGDVTEIDHNRNYVAYESLPEYQGFPSHQLVAVAPAYSKSPAFYVINNITGASESFREFYHYKSGPIVLPTPTVKYLLGIGATIDIDYILEATFKNMSIYGFADSLGVSGDDKKDFGNSLVGRTITGGINQMNKVHLSYTGDVERDQIIAECQERGLQYADDILYITVEIPSVSTPLYHFHSYILSYAAIHMMRKWDSLAMPIVAYCVDALVVQGHHNFESRPGVVGAWKTTTKIGRFYSETRKSERFNSREYTLPARPPVLERFVYVKNTIILAAAGVGKSRPHKLNPVPGQIMTAPTHKLKNEIKETFDNCVTTHKYFQFTMTDKQYELARRQNKLPKHSDYIVIDELSMYSKNNWETILRRSAGSIIVALGDFEQIRNDIYGEAVTREWFESHGFDVIEMDRDPAIPARQSYEFGCELDALRGHLPRIQKQKLISMYGKPQEKTSLNIVDNRVHDHVIVGSHAVAHRYNVWALSILPEGVLFPYKKIGKAPEIVWLSNPADVFMDRMSYDDPVPAGCKYEPAFAVTADSFQGQTIDHEISIDIDSLTRPGTLYTAVTRVRAREHNRIVCRE